MAERTTPRSQERFGVLDALRGAALCGMVAYHATWDLADLGWPVTSPAASPAWTLFGGLVAGTFLGLSGIALVLASPKGVQAARRRLIVLALAAACVSAASAWFAPDRLILFGILHCLAVSNTLALVMLRWPASTRLALAALVLTVPNVWRSSAFDDWPLAALGLGFIPPPTLDYRPLLPWLAVVLVGTVLGDVLQRHPRLGGSDRTGPPSLRWLGRHSLAVYLLHQPILYGGLLLGGAAAGGPAPNSDPFTLQCRSDCAATGVAPRLCSAACACTAERLASEAGSTVGARQTLTPRHLEAVGQACRAAGG